MNFTQLFQRLSGNPAKPTGVVQKIALFLLTAAVFAVSLVVSVALLAVVLSVGVIGGGYVWWKLRGARRKMGEQRRPGGEVIEGVVIREVRTREEEPR